MVLLGVRLLVSGVVVEGRHYWFIKYRSRPSSRDYWRRCEQSGVCAGVEIAQSVRLDRSVKQTERGLLRRTTKAEDRWNVVFNEIGFRATDC